MIITSPLVILTVDEMDSMSSELLGLIDELVKRSINSALREAVSKLAPPKKIKQPRGKFSISFISITLD